MGAFREAGNSGAGPAAKVVGQEAACRLQKLHKIHCLLRRLLSFGLDFMAPHNYDAPVRLAGWMRNPVHCILGSLLAAALLVGTASRVAAQPPQKLPSALLIFPLLQSNGYHDTRIELVNLSGFNIELQCFYLYENACFEVGFFLDLTPHQPVSWLTSQGALVPFTNFAIPPFFGQGELKCAVVASRPEVEYHNAVQGRATVFAQNGQTISYGATAFRRISDGPYTGVFNLNNSTYTACPSRLHFQVLTDETLPNELVLVTCDEDLVTQTPTRVTVQFIIINEFEQSFSASITFECFDRRVLSGIGSFFTRPILGTDTAHVIARGVTGGILGLAIDAVQFDSSVRTAGNEPSLEGSRSATVRFP